MSPWAGTGTVTRLDAASAPAGIGQRISNNGKAATPRAIVARA